MTETKKQDLSEAEKHDLDLKKQAMASYLWMKYFNQIVYENELISQRDYVHLSAEIGKKYDPILKKKFHS